MEAAGPCCPRARWKFARGGAWLSIETGLRVRGASSPERGGVPLEGASDPQARRNLTRGGDRPTSEAKLHQRGVVPLERSGVPLEGG
jgi:hypothetical protein